MGCGTRSANGTSSPNLSHSEIIVAYQHPGIVGYRGSCVESPAVVLRIAVKARPSTEPVRERPSELRIDRAVEEEVEREVGKLESVEKHPCQHHSLAIDGRRTGRNEMNEEVEQFARINEANKHNDDGDQSHV